MHPVSTVARNATTPNPATVMRLIYPLPEIKGKVWDPVIRPEPRWMRVGCSADTARPTA